MKEPYTGIGVCNCKQCRLHRRNCSTIRRRFSKRTINKFRRKQLKQDEIIKTNRNNKYWA